MRSAPHKNRKSKFETSRTTLFLLPSFYIFLLETFGIIKQEKWSSLSAWYDFVLFFSIFNNFVLCYFPDFFFQLSKLVICPKFLLKKSGRFISKGSLLDFWIVNRKLVSKEIGLMRKGFMWFNSFHLELHC